eukprot:2832530-Amphidinium_carterae.2
MVETLNVLIAALLPVSNMSVYLTSGIGKLLLGATGVAPSSLFTFAGSSAGGQRTVETSTLATKCCIIAWKTFLHSLPHVSLFGGVAVVWGGPVDAFQTSKLCNDVS